jgi:DNA-binding MarR family transcriptional regulator
VTPTREAERLAEAVERLIAVILRQRGAIGGNEPTPLSTTQVVALSAVADAGSLRLGALADLLGTTDATASRSVDGLQGAGLVRRERDPADRRGIYVTITDAGRNEVETRRARLAAMLGVLLRELPDEDARRFVDLLGELNALLSVADETSA